MQNTKAEIHKEIEQLNSLRKQHIDIARETRRRQILTEQKPVTGTRIDLITLQGMLKRDVEAYRKRQGTPRSDVEDSIRKDSSEHWPEGFEIPGKHTAQQKMTLFLCRKNWVLKNLHAMKEALQTAPLSKNQQKRLSVALASYTPPPSLLPDHFVQCWQFALTSRNLLRKTTLTEHSTHDLSYDEKNDRITMWPLMFSKEKFMDPISTTFEAFDPYMREIKDPKLQGLYTKLFTKRVNEGDIAHEAKHALDRRRLISTSTNIDEWKTWLSLRCCRETQLYATLSYFRSNPEKLDNQDWLTLFHSLLFEGDILLEELKNFPQAAIQLREFFEQQIQIAVALNNTVRGANLLWLASEVDRYAKRAASPEPVLTLECIDSAVPALLNKAKDHHKGVFAESLHALTGNLLAYEKDPQKRLWLMAYQHFSAIVSNQKQIASEYYIGQRAQEAERAGRERKELFSLLTQQEQTQIVAYVVPLLAQFFPDLDLTQTTIALISDMEFRLTDKVTVEWDPLESTCRHASLSIL